MCNGSLTDFAGTLKRGAVSTDQMRVVFLYDLRMAVQDNVVVETEMFGGGSLLI